MAKLQDLLTLDYDVFSKVFHLIDFSKLDEVELFEIYNKLEPDLSFGEWVAINK